MWPVSVSSFTFTHTAATLTQLIHSFTLLCSLNCCLNVFCSFLLITFCICFVSDSQDLRERGKNRDQWPQIGDSTQDPRLVDCQDQWLIVVVEFESVALPYRRWTLSIPAYRKLAVEMGYNGLSALTIFKNIYSFFSLRMHRKKSISFRA